MPQVRLKASKGLRGKIKVQGDKSISHRAIMLGAMAHGQTTVESFLPSEDCLRTLGACEAMGLKVDRTDETTVVIQGAGMQGLREPQTVLDMGNSGTGFRLLSGILAGRDFFSVLTGDESLRGRPMDRVVEPLRKMGANISGREGGRLAPLCIQGTQLHGISYSHPVPRAQVKSSLLLAGLTAEGETSIIEPQLTRDHTERMLGLFGIQFEKEGTEISLWGGQRWKGRNIVVPGDLSSTAFFLVAGSIVEGSDISIENVGVNPTRTGILDALWKMGADITLEHARDISGEPVADLRVKSSYLKGITVPRDWNPRLIDEFPILCIAAACAQGETEFQGVGELRLKESDRIATMVEGLRKLGVEIEEYPDGIKIVGKGGLKAGVMDSHGDHRVAMSFLVSGLVAEGETVVEGTQCIDTSFPKFMPLLMGLMDQ